MFPVRVSIAMTTVVQAYRFALDPTPEQDSRLRSHCGGQRYAYNWGLARVTANLGQRKAEASYDLAEEELTPSLNWSAYSLRKDWNQTKREIAPWWDENSKEAYSSGLANLATALKNWDDSRRGKRKGCKLGFPRFKGRRGGLSCRFTTGSCGLVDADRRHVKLPRIGVVRTHESTRKLARHVERGTGRIRSATVSFRAGRWFVSFSVEITRTIRHPTLLKRGRCGSRGQALAVLSTGPGSSTTGWWPTHGIWKSPCGNCGGCSVRPPVDRGGTGVPGRSRHNAGTRPKPGSPVCTPQSRTPAETGCTN